MDDKAKVNEGIEKLEELYLKKKEEYVSTKVNEIEKAHGRR